jgi:Protein of unknown function (DUF3306)
LVVAAMADSKDDGVRSDGFLSRWSRRKQDVRAGVPVAEVPLPDVALATDSAKPLQPHNLKPNQPLAQQNIAGAATNTVASDSAEADDHTRARALPPAPTLDDANALTIESDFKPFMVSNVSPEVKNAAMKKLFTDPHYNVMDMMDIYVDDYSKSDPIPESMLKEMVSVKFLKLFERDEEEAVTSGEKSKNAAQTAPLAQPVADTSQETPPQARDDAYTPVPQTVAQLAPSAPLDFETASQPLQALESPSPLPFDTPNPHDDPDLRLQPNHAPEREGVGRRAG